MATTTGRHQIIQKVNETDTLILHPETEAEVVLYDNTASGLTATDVKSALDELKTNLDGVTGGGVVTGVKGGAETAYRTGQVNITKENIGLSRVDNTADADKPVSTAQQAAIDAVKADAAGKYLPVCQKGAAGGVASLGSDGKVPAAQLPSYVDDVLEFDTLADFPEAGEGGKLYVAKDTNKTYRWSGSTYVEISESVALGETAGTAYAGDKGKANADAIAALQAEKGNYQTKTDSTLPTAAKTVVGAIGEIKTTADAASAAASANAADITKLTDGTTPAGKAAKLAAARTISLAGDATGSASFDGGTNVTITAALKASGVAAGSYSAVSVNAKGVVTAGAQVIEVGTAGQAAPSASLAAGGLFFKKL